MNSKEIRKAWLIFKDGSPLYLRFALVKTYAETSPALSDAERRNYCALWLDELEADGWDATPTAWRRCPPGMEPAVLQNPAIALRVEGRDVVSAGLRYNLDEGGRVHPDHSEKDEREPLEPDAVLDNESDLLDMAEELGHDVRFVEKGSGLLHRVRGGSRGADDASTDADLIKSLGADVIHSRMADGRSRKVAKR